jgi:hypothetical protein
MRYVSYFSAVFLFLLPCWAQAAGDLVVGSFRIENSQNPEPAIEFVLKQKSSPEGTQISKDIASIWGIPDFVVDLESYQYKEWIKFIDHTWNSGNEHAGIIRSPEGYSICFADTTSPEVSEGSTLNLRIQRDPTDNGLGWYMVVPKPGLFEGGESAGINVTIAFVRATAEIWNKFSSHCQETNLLIVECKGSDCKEPRIWHPGE